MRSITLDFQTLTPLFTGGVDNKMPRLLESGLMGGLRWWFESLVRGMGGLAYDPTSRNRSGFDTGRFACREASKIANDRARLRFAGLDDAAQIFGATGWRRRFRLEVAATRFQDQADAFPVKLNSRRHKDEPPSWYLPDNPKMGTFSLVVQQLYPDFDPEVIVGLLRFVTRWAGLGARNQLGLGIVELTKSDSADGTRQLYNWLTKMPPTETGAAAMQNLPGLRNMFFARVTADSDYRDRTFELKYDLRRLFANDRRVRHIIMGSIAGGQRIGAKIKISRPFGTNHEIRIWGWLPGLPSGGKTWTRDSALDAVHGHLRDNCANLTWREFDSPRDNVEQVSDMKNFLAQMLAIDGVAG